MVFTSKKLLVPLSIILVCTVATGAYYMGAESQKPGNVKSVSIQKIKSPTATPTVEEKATSSATPMPSITLSSTPATPSPTLSQAKTTPLPSLKVNPSIIYRKIASPTPVPTIFLKTTVPPKLPIYPQ